LPDATTIWLFRGALVEAGLIDKLFERFSHHLQAKGFINLSVSLPWPSCLSFRQTQSGPSKS